MAKNKEYEAIIKSIEDGLTGNLEKDAEYLGEQGEKYKDHKYGKEIIRACGRMMYEIIPNEKREELDKALREENVGFDAKMEEVRFNIFKKNYNKALALLEEMIDQYDGVGMFEDDSVSEYYCFKEPMEEVIYRQYHPSDKTLRHSPISYVDMYLEYGALLVELNRINEAADALCKARSWNPSNAKIAFEYAETFKLRGMMDDFALLTRDVFNYAFRPEDLARCYRNMAYYYTETKEYKLAVCCLMYSNEFEKSEMVSSELYYISQVTGEMYQPTQEELNKCFEDNSIPSAPNEEIMKLAYAYGKQLYEQGDYVTAGYFLGIVAGFFDDKEVNKMIEECKAEASGA